MITTMVGENIDLTSFPSGDVPKNAAADGLEKASRRFLGITFACCDVYTRVYINQKETAYEGHCPKCARQVRLGIGPGGTDQRFFTAQ